MLSNYKTSLSGPLINRHLHLPGTIFDHKFPVPGQTARAGQVCVTCVNSVFSMKQQCLRICTRWLHPLLPPPRMFSAYFCEYTFFCSWITWSFLIICRTTKQEIKFYSPYIWYFNEICWVHDYTQYTCFLVTDIFKLWAPSGSISPR